MPKMKPEIEIYAPSLEPYFVPVKFNSRRWRRIKRRLKRQRQQAKRHPEKQKELVSDITAEQLRIRFMNINDL